MHQCSTMQCSAVQCSAAQCSAVQCSAVQFSAVQCSTVQCSAVQCSAVQCNAVQCSAEQCRSVQCTAVQCSAVQCSLMQFGRGSGKNTPYKDDLLICEVTPGAVIIFLRDPPFPYSVWKLCGIKMSRRGGGRGWEDFFLHRVSAFMFQIKMPFKNTPYKGDLFK
jgi:hypothetical protein